MNDVSETVYATATTGKVQRPGLIARGGSILLRLAWKLFMLPFSITASIVRLITGSVQLGFWVAAGVLSYSLRVIGLSNSGRHRLFEGPASPEEMLAELHSVLEEGTSALVAARLDSKENRKNTQSEEQDAAYPPAHEADQVCYDPKTDFASNISNVETVHVISG
ncbi:hypothetical protein L1987_72068 [Smallanthus sonchifolius]|uniref:Uncharacterized protein n=1 Tax=Smallanthus sonchifolius TaxID=185202 RepID=A0ACB9AV32_9ASTR|nr:hypothetical protein L1987_72068 [Smallanthus sonchifolius]